MAVQEARLGGEPGWVRRSVLRAVIPEPALRHQLTRTSADVERRTVDAPGVPAALHGCLTSRERLSLEVLKIGGGTKLARREASRLCDRSWYKELMKMGAILLIVLIAALLATHWTMLHHFGSPYR